MKFLRGMLRLTIWSLYNSNQMWYKNSQLHAGNIDGLTNLALEAKPLHLKTYPIEKQKSIRSS